MSTSKDKSVKVWNGFSFMEDYKLEGHTDWVIDIKYDEKK